MSDNKKVFWVTALRWVGLLPLGLVSVALISFPIHWFVLGNFGIRDREIMLNVEVFLQGIFAPMLLIFVGAVVAPSYKMTSAVVLVCLLIAFIVTGHFWWAGDRMNYQWTNALAQFLGVLGGLALVWRQKTMSNSFE